MTKDEELEQLRAENAFLREELARAQEQLQALQDRLGKDSHNNSLPPPIASCVHPRACGRRAHGLRNEGFNSTYKPLSVGSTLSVSISKVVKSGKLPQFSMK